MLSCSNGRVRGHLGGTPRNSSRETRQTTVDFPVCSGVEARENPKLAKQTQCFKNNSSTNFPTPALVTSGDKEDSRIVSGGGLEIGEKYLLPLQSVWTWKTFIDPTGGVQDHARHLPEFHEVL